MSGTGGHAGDYRLHGLRIRSAIALPELYGIESEDVPDVSIRWGSVETVPVANGSVHLTEDGATFAIDGVARYAVREGCEIVVDAEPAAAPRNVRLYVLGSAMGLVLHQRGMLPLHANAIELDGRAYAFAGRSGAGKSTLAVWFHDRGFPVLADDVCVIDASSAAPPQVQPGLRRFRLWQDALVQTGRQTDAFDRSYAGDEDYLKFDVPAGLDRSKAAPIELGGIYLLEKGDRFEIERLTGLEAAEAVIANTYRGEYVALVGHPERHWSACMRLVREVPVFRATRVWDLDRLEEGNRRLLEHAAAAEQASRG